MRGIVSGAMLIALRDLDLAQHIDTYYGSSAAGINLAHFLQGRTWDALSMYYDYLPSGLFRSPIRSKFKPPLDMQYVRELFHDHFPLRQCEQSLHVQARVLLTNVDQVSTEVVDLSQPELDLVETVIAGAWLPILAGRPMSYNGSRYLDGGVLQAHPIYAAINDGHTHILALSPAADDAQSTHSHVTRWALRGTLNHWQANLGDRYLESRFLWDRDRLRLGRTESRMGLASVLRLTPSAGAHEVTRMTTDKGTLLEGARQGYRSILSEFGTGDHSVIFKAQFG